jgi:hypothetical protein
VRILLHCSTFLKSEDHRLLFEAWLRLACRLNWGQESRGRSDRVDILIVDQPAPSGIDPRSTIELVMQQARSFWTERLMNNDQEIPAVEGNTLLRFRNALGHPVHDNVEVMSGPDRAWMKAIECATAAGYDKVVYIESDVLCMRPVSWAFDRMHKPVASAGPIPGQSFDELALFFADVEYLWKSDFVARFNWQGPTKPEGEARMMEILGEAREVLPLRGNRDGARTAPDELEQNYPDGLDYLTHARLDTLRAMLERNQLGGCWPGVADL